MAFNVRHPLWLPAAPKPGIKVIATLFFIETFARASIATVIPVQVYDLLQDEQKVSFVYTATGIAALGLSIVIPVLIRLTSRRWTYTIGCLLFIVAAALLATFTLPGQIAGMVVRVAGAACLNVTLSLYILDYIRKEQYVQNDAVRMTFSTIGWTIAPYLGVWIYTNYGPGAAYLLSAAFAVILICVFWYLRLTDAVVIVRARTPAANPLRYFGRFFSQKRLRIAWFIAFCRSSFWSSLYVYGPLLMITSGLGAEAGGILISVANAMLILTFIFARLSGRFGVRRLAASCFLFAAAMLFVTGYTGGDLPMTSAVLLLLGSGAVVGLDAIGGVAFYRAVRSYERAEMSSVYRTYMDVGELLPPVLYAFLLGFFGLGSVFVALGFQMCLAACIVLAFIPRRL
ncbi:MAG: MFS transporter [Alphaproteobacteria bacterium]